MKYMNKGQILGLGGFPPLKKLHRVQSLNMLRGSARLWSCSPTWPSVEGLSSSTLARTRNSKILVESQATQAKQTGYSADERAREAHLAQSLN